ncbi:hypothetical protein [Streptomyces sp. NPDC002088]|uniref:hypothetical protein n=1 Tax=Streptomyces sp. NPDC002088 TaxID=3154665 RepID=UPI00332B4BD9
MWFVSRRRHNAELAAARAETGRLRSERDQLIEERDAFKYTAESVSEKYTDTALVNERLTEDLTKARRLLNADLLPSADVYRKGLAVALDASLERGWDDLLADAARINRIAAQRAAEIAGLNTHLNRARADLVELSGELADGREARRPIDGGSSKPRTESDELRQAKAHARDLAAQLATITTANLRCTCRRPS